MLSDKRLFSPNLKNVEINDTFWSKYVELVHNIVVPYQWEIINDRVEGTVQSHCIRNFKIAAGLMEGEFSGMVFQDTDLAKWLEAVAFCLETKPDPELEKLADEAIELIAKVQDKDGYINTYFTMVEPEKRWTNLLEGHELYTAGHFIEAAVAYYKATGKKRFLEIMCRFADSICELFGKGEGRIPGYPGHQEIELALVKLYYVTDQKKYLDMSKFFIDERGTEPCYFDEEVKKRDYKYHFPWFEGYDKAYSQYHLPVKQQTTAEGHAVRAVYMYSAMAELAYEYKDIELFDACNKLYDNITQKRMFITGSIGSAGLGERFTCDYDLPNDTNYSETCASIGLAMFAMRMLQVSRDGRYGDTVEKALYNTVLSGISLKGTEFFYVNPLEVWPKSCKSNPTKKHVKTERQKWFGVACCPPNIARTIASLSQYIYSHSDDEIYVNLFVSNNAKFDIKGNNIELTQKTLYPYDSKVHLTVKSESELEWTLAVRIPGWCRGHKVTMNGKEINTAGMIENNFLKIKQVWNGVQDIEVIFDMHAELVGCNPNVRANEGKAAIVKGPLLYCIEEIDNGENLPALEISPDVVFKEYYDPSLLYGTNVITFKGKRVDQHEWSESELYRPYNKKTTDVEIKAIPYHLWNNRGEGEMLVWIRVKD